MIRLEALSEKALPAFKEMMGSDDFGGCFCAVWTSHDETWVSRCQDKSQPNYRVTQRNVESGRHVGFLVYEGNDLIGWTGSGSKPSFPFLKTKLGSRLSPMDEKVWSVGCIALVAKARGRNLSDPIVEAVIEQAKKDGAKAIEAYPTRPWDEPRRFRGSLGLYQRLGFKEASAEKDGNTDIVLMRMELDH